MSRLVGNGGREPLGLIFEGTVCQGRGPRTCLHEDGCARWSVLAPVVPGGMMLLGPADLDTHFTLRRARLSPVTLIDTAACLLRLLDVEMCRVLLILPAPKYVGL